MVADRWVISERRAHSPAGSSVLRRAQRTFAQALPGLEVFEKTAVDRSAGSSRLASFPCRGQVVASRLSDEFRPRSNTHTKPSDDGSHSLSSSKRLFITRELASNINPVQVRALSRTSARALVRCGRSTMWTARIGTSLSEGLLGDSLRNRHRHERSIVSLPRRTTGVSGAGASSASCTPLGVGGASRVGQTGTWADPTTSTECGCDGYSSQADRKRAPSRGSSHLDAVRDSSESHPNTLHAFRRHRGLLSTYCHRHGLFVSPAKIVSHETQIDRKSVV